MNEARIRSILKKGVWWRSLILDSRLRGNDR